MKKQIFVTLEEYWWQLHRSRTETAINQAIAPAAVPYRKNFDPMKIPSVLPFISLMEYLGPKELRLRVVGTELDRMLPVAKTGENLYEFYPGNHWGSFSGLHENIVGVPCGLNYVRMITLNTGEHFEVSRISYPFADLNGEVRFIINAMHSSSDRKTAYDSYVRIAEEEVLSMDYIDIGYGVPDDRYPESARQEKVV